MSGLCIVSLCECRQCHHVIDELIVNTNRPGLLNSLAGIISVLSNIYGVQNGTYSTTGKSTIIVTAAVAVVCGCLVLVYQFWLLRNIKNEHDKEVGIELAGKHGEGIVGDEAKK
jgi:hypothetical protein